MNESEINVIYFSVSANNFHNFVAQRGVHLGVVAMGPARCWMRRGSVCVRSSTMDQDAASAPKQTALMKWTMMEVFLD